MFVLTWKEVPETPYRKSILKNDLPSSQVCPSLEEALDLVKHMREKEGLRLSEVRIYSLTEQAFGVV